MTPRRIGSRAFSALLVLVAAFALSNLNGVPGAQAQGLVCDGATDNTTALRNLVSALGTTGGTVSLPAASGPCNFSGTVVFPRNVTLAGAGPDATNLQYTGSGVAMAWADSGSGSAYHRGGARDCTISAKYTGTGTGLWTGGDPAGVVAPSGDYGDFLTFINLKVTGFSIGYQLGNNTWDITFLSPAFMNNTIGWYLTDNLTNDVENLTAHGGAISNGTIGIKDNDVNSDLVLDGVSLDGMSGSAIVAGDAPSGAQGGTVELNNPHIEYFSYAISGPVFYLYGQSVFSSISVRDGVIQFDDASPTAEALVKMCSSTACTTAGNPHTGAFQLSGTQIHSAANISYTGSCRYTSSGVCIEGDTSAQDAKIGPYNYWTGTSFGSPSGSQFLPGLENLIQYYGSGSFAAPTRNSTSPQMPVCVTDAAACALGTTYASGGGTTHCRVQCNLTHWVESGIGC
jgi:hypothetical protein